MSFRIILFISDSKVRTTYDSKLDSRVDNVSDYFPSFVLSGFPTERWEMEIVASKFERDGLIDYKEFVNSLKDKKPVNYNHTYSIS